MEKFFDKKVVAKVRFERDGFLVDVILQNYITKRVLFGASMREEDLLETIEKGVVVLWSKSRRIRWMKGESSGNFLKVVRIMLNCENNQLLIQVIPSGEGVCHEKDRKGRYRKTCFFRVLLREKITKEDFVYYKAKEEDEDLSLYEED